MSKNKNIINYPVPNSGASVKIMLSYDYCHFEISKATDQNVSDSDINKMRKDVQRLADEAVRQYKISKNRSKEESLYQRQQFLDRIAIINLKPENSWSVDDKAMMKQFRDDKWQEQFEPYDYTDADEPEFSEYRTL